MRQTTVLRVLKVLMLLILFTGRSNSQEPTKTLSLSEYKVIIKQLQEGREAKDSLIAYKSLLEKADTALKAREKEIVRKEGVIVRTLDQRNGCYNERDNLTAQMKAKDDIIAVQEDNIRRLGSHPKYWNVSISAGYGYALGSTVQRGPVLALTLGRTIFKF